MKTVGVNGFGRIGRCFTRIALQDPQVDVALVNDLADVKTLAHLLKYDSIHGPYQLSFEIDGNTLIFENGKKLVFISERNPELINWAAYGVEVVIEATGLFLTREAASKHLIGGAKHVVISAPANDFRLTLADAVAGNGHDHDGDQRAREGDQWLRAGPTSAESERLKALERENRELRQANEILRKASAYFAMAELDRRSK